MSRRHVVIIVPVLGAVLGVFLPASHELRNQRQSGEYSLQGCVQADDRYACLRQGAQDCFIGVARYYAYNDHNGTAALALCVQSGEAYQSRCAAAVKTDLKIF